MQLIITICSIFWQKKYFTTRCVACDTTAENVQTSFQISSKHKQNIMLLLPKQTSQAGILSISCLLIQTGSLGLHFLWQKVVWQVFYHYFLLMQPGSLFPNQGCYHLLEHIFLCLKYHLQCFILYCLLYNKPCPLPSWQGSTQP